tara:strand:- start:315 stop:1346 length:1032 start_codon:yes stop_codon:yes gene_type:complete
MELVKLMSEPEYRQVNAISYSMLSGVDKTPASLINTEKFSSPALTYGSAVDTYVFDGEEEFKKKFTVNTGESPSWKVEQIMTDIIKSITTQKGALAGELDEYETLILATALAHEYGKGWKPETITRKILDEGGRDMFNFMRDNVGKQILSTDQYENVLNSANTLFTHDFSRKWITADENQEIHYQFPILWNWKGKPCKSLFDIIKIDHKEKVIYPIDLKTTGDHVLGFASSFVKWKYYLQASFYTEALKYFKLENEELFDYRVDIFRFLIISSGDPRKPLVYETTENDLFVGKNGGSLRYNSNEVRGFDKIIEDMEWHMGNQLYDYPRNVYESDGILTLDVFN